MFLRLSVFIVRKVEDWTLRILEFQLPVSDHLKLLVGLFDPFFLSANRLSDGGSHLFARSFSFRCFHIDKKLNVNISVAKIGSFSETTKSFAKKFPASGETGNNRKPKRRKGSWPLCAPNSTVAVHLQVDVESTLRFEILLEFLNQLFVHFFNRFS